MSNKDDLKRNAEHYYDPTAGEALRRVSAEEEKHNKVLRAIFAICDAAGFRVEGRIVLVDKSNGKVWR